VVDLVTAVVNRVDALGNAQRVEDFRGMAVACHRRVGDHSHVDSSRHRIAQRSEQVLTPEFVHLDHHPHVRRCDEVADQPEDARVLPKAHRLGGTAVG